MKRSAFIDKGSGLLSENSAKNPATLLSPKIPAIHLCRNEKDRDSNSQLECPATLIVPLVALPQLPTTKSQLIITTRSYARIKYRVYICIWLGSLLGIAGEAGYDGSLAGVRKKCTLYKCSRPHVRGERGPAELLACRISCACVSWLRFSTVFCILWK